MSGGTLWPSAWGPSAMSLEKGGQRPGLASQISALKETKDFKAEMLR